jgi:hypothetical protein
MRVTITDVSETVLDFNPSSKNVLIPTVRNERTAAFAALCGALAVVAGLDIHFSPRKSGSVDATQPTDDIASSE